MYENGESVSENGFPVSQTDPSFNHHSNFTMGMDHFQQQLGLNQFVQEIVHDLNQPNDDPQNWENDITYTTNFTTQNVNPIDEQNGHLLNFNPSAFSNFMSHYPPSMLATSSFPFVNQPINPENFTLNGDLLGSNVVYEARDLYNQGCSFNGVDDRMGWEHEIGEGSKYRGKGITKSKEKIRREEVNNKFQALRSLVPNPTKNDKASIIADAIDYVKELLRTKNELKILVDKKRRERERNKRQKISQDTGADVELNNKPEACEPYGSSSVLRSSWLQRKSKETEVDVRIVDDEVTIKLAQKRKTDCLLVVSKVLDELQLDIHHVAGGLVGDNFSFLFNTKICEGSIVYASAIANKIIEVVERNYEANQLVTNF